MLINISLSEATFRKLTKDDVITLTLEYQAKLVTLSNINKELSELCNNFRNIESGLSISKDLSKKDVALETMSWE